MTSSDFSKFPGIPAISTFSWNSHDVVAPTAPLFETDLPARRFEQVPLSHSDGFIRFLEISENPKNVNVFLDFV